MPEEDWACTLQTLSLRSESRNQTGIVLDTECLCPASRRRENARHLTRHAAKLAVTMLLASANAERAPLLLSGMVQAQDTGREMQCSLHRHKTTDVKDITKDYFHSAERTARRTKVFDLSSCIDFRFSSQGFLYGFGHFFSLSISINIFFTACS